MFNLFDILSDALSIRNPNECPYCHIPGQRAEYDVSILRCKQGHYWTTKEVARA